MSTLAATNPTMADMAQIHGKDGKVIAVVEQLGLTNEILDDATVLEANDGMGHKTSIRSGIPAGTFRKLYGGVPAEKGRVIGVRDSSGMLESYSEIDKALYDMQADGKGWRMQEDNAFIEGLGQTMATTLIYGDTSTTPEKFMGLAPRYNSLSADNADNIIDAGGTTNLTSVWVGVWHPQAAHLFFPKGSKVGLSVRDLGENTALDASSNPYQVLRTHFKWDVGFSLRDWRYWVRIANIDYTALTKNAATGADLSDLIVRAMELLPVMKLGRPVVYANRTIRSYFRRQINNKSNVWLNQSEVGGKPVMNFAEAPVRRVDAILNTETRVV